jgi:hypothetical protein
MLITKGLIMQFVPSRHLFVHYPCGKLLATDSKKLHISSVEVFEVFFMAGVTINNVMVCAQPAGKPGEYVANTGRIASVSDRVELWRHSKTLEGRSEGIKLDASRVDCENSTEVCAVDPER